MGNHLLRSVFVVLALLSFTASASVVLPGDGPYYRYRKSPNLYIYPEEATNLVDQLMAYTEAIRRNYEASFGWALDEESDVILTSSRQQIANAYATVVPNIKTVWFPSGAQLLEYMAQSSWLLALSNHETAHLYQLNAKGPVNSFVKKIFGNAIVVQPIIPIFIHPNIFTPTFMLEGNAVMNESRFNLGGRLHSGEVRALVLAQIAAGDIDPNRLINDQFRFPYGATPYSQGAYFQAHLAAKHGVDKTNQFFAAQGDHWLWPLVLNKTFRDHFGHSYNQEIREYLREMEPLARQQKASTGFTVSDTAYIEPLNHDADRVWYLAADHKRLPVLTVFSKKEKRVIETKRVDLEGGKIFWNQKGQPETAVASRHDLHHIEYSLYGEGAEFNPQFRGQIVTDQRAGKTVALDARNGWLDPQLLVNGEPYDVAHSSGILDDQGSVYYFRQNGAQRILYKNREPVFKFDGFYAKPTEVTADGTIYFVGATNSGSSLFQYKGKEISRVLDSDRVIDARKLNDTQFLVTEIDNRGHRAIVTDAKVKAQNPVVYSYGFPSRSLVPEKLTPKEEIKAEQREYNSLSQIRLSSIDFAAGYSSGDGATVLVGPTWVDPMEFQALSLSYLSSEKDDEAFLGQYQFTKYLPDFFLGYYYHRENTELFDPVTNDDYYLKSYDYQAFAGVLLPVLRHKRWDGDVSLVGFFEHEDMNEKSAFEETFGTFTTASLTYSVYPGLALYPWREFNFAVYNRLNALSEDWSKKDNSSLVHAEYTHGFPLEFYANLSGNMAWAETNDIAVEYNPYPAPNTIHIPRLTSIDEADVKTAGSVRLEVRKVFNIPLYSPRIPAAFSRIAPLVAAQGIFMDQSPTKDYPESTFEYAAGADIELVLLHRLMARIRILLLAADTRHPNENDEQVNFTLKQDF